MEVPFLDLDAQHRTIRDEIDAALARIVDETAFILGPSVAEFEEEFAAFIGRQRCVGVNSGTSALHLALLVADVGSGDEVVTTPHTWISTSWAVAYCGARPVYADVDPATGTLDPEAAEAAITHRTKALLPVDLYGNPAQLDRFEELAETYDLTLIDDAAQAHGARLHDRPVGSFGQLACFSFYPGKNLGAAGEAGAVVTDDPELAARLRALRDHAQEGRHHHVEVGYNYRMDGLQAAVLTVKLRHLGDWNGARRAAAGRYAKLLGNLGGVRLPSITDGATPVHHLYVIRVDHRDQVARRLGERGVGTGVHYPTPVHRQPAFDHLGYAAGDFPAAEEFAARCLTLPMYPEITDFQLEHVAQSLRDVIAEVVA